MDFLKGFALFLIVMVAIHVTVMLFALPFGYFSWSRADQAQYSREVVTNLILMGGVYLAIKTVGKIIADYYKG